MNPEKNNELGFDPSLGYQKHQRDYSMLGSSVVVRGLFNENKNFFNVAPNPIFLVQKNGLFYHFMSKKDGARRVQSWLSTHELNDLVAIESSYDARLCEFNAFCQDNHSDPNAAIRQLYSFFIDFTNIVFIGFEFLEHLDDSISPEQRDLCFSIRKKYEDVHKRCFDIEGRLLFQLESQFGLKRGCLNRLTITEFESFLENGSLPPADERDSFFVVRYSSDGEKRFWDPALWPGFEEKHAGILRGQTAHPGIVEGTVRVILKVEDAKFLQENEILVASMTDPRYVPVMQKASAIVTDEGGITCHAAIVSRELQKPCITGVKGVLHALKTGDRICVDATHGTVQKLDSRNAPNDTE